MLSTVVITRNEEKMIRDCLVSLQFADEIIIVDTGNTDSTNTIARSQGAKIITSKGADYSQFRNAGLKVAQGDWILYVDADERVTPALRLEIQRLITAQPSQSAFGIPRQNIFLGKTMHFGGWGGDHVMRLFKTRRLKKWAHPLHERPVVEGEIGYLSHPLTHFSHRDLSSMLQKTLQFTAFEAQLRFKAHHPQVVAWRFLRVMVTEFWHRFIKLSAWRDGPEGIIDGLFQVFNAFVIYSRLWEMQYAKTHPAD